jgi:hypothetical protein
MIHMSNDMKKITNAFYATAFKLAKNNESCQLLEQLKRNVQVQEVGCTLAQDLEEAINEGRNDGRNARFTEN